MYMKTFFTLFTILLICNLVLGQDNSIIYDAPPTVSKEDLKKPEIYDYIVDTMPMFGGCEHLEDYREQFACSSEKLREYISKAKPSKKVNDLDEGKKVPLRFVVNEDGSLSDFEVLRSSGNKILDQSAINHMKKSPNWVPGKHNNEIVKVRMSLAVSF